jgi:hypothetical protein
MAAKKRTAEDDLDDTGAAMPEAGKAVASGSEPAWPANFEDLEAEAMADLEARIAQEELDLRERLKVEPMALEEEFIRCPGDIAYMGAKSSRALALHLHARTHAKRLRGLLMVEHRQRLVNLGGKTTVGEVDAAVDSDPRWLRAKVAEDNADALREKAKGDFSAIMAKRDMLMQMGASVRAEMQFDPSTRTVRQHHRG